MEIVNTVPITIDFRKPSKIPMPQVHQYDTNEFEFTVLENGTPADLSTVDRFVANYRRPDKSVITREITALGNVITYPMGAEEMAVEGLGELNVQLFRDNRRLSSMAMKVYVHQNLGAAFEGGEGLPLLQDLFVEVAGLVEESQSNSTYALNQGDYAKEQAEIAEAESANLAQIKTDAVSATDSANTAAGLANANAAEAETQAAYAKEQGDYANAEYLRLKDTDVSTLSAQLAEKASKTEARLKAEKIQLEDMSETTLGAMSGSATFDLLSIPQDGSVTPVKTNFISLGKNLVDASAIIKNKMINRTTGELGDTPNVDSSGFIPVSPNTQYCPRRDSRFAFYDSSKNFISAGGSTTLDIGVAGIPFTTPSNCHFVRISWKTNQDFRMQLEKGGTFTTYEPYALKLQKTVAFSRNEMRSVQTELQYNSKGNVTKVLETIEGILIRETTLNYSNGKLISVVSDDRETLVKQQKTLVFTGNTLTSVTTVML